MHSSSLARALPLALTLVASGCTETKGHHQVVASGQHVTIAPAGQTLVEDGKTLAIGVIADAGYTLLGTVGGDCPAGTWSGSVYTTGLIHADCDISFTASLPMSPTFTVTAGGDGNEAIAPSAPQTVAVGATASVTVSAASGYTLSTTVGGDCPAGTWSGSIYTTGAITADCSLSFAADASTTTLAVSHSPLLLAVTGLTLDGSPSGTARQVQIFNSGSNDALDVVIGTSGLPAGTTESNDCGATLAAGSTCIVTITPGATPSTPPPAAPTFATVSVGANNAATLSVDVAVVTWGNLLQGGLIFDIDDSTPVAVNIGGKVVATADTKSVVYSADIDTILDIDDSSTPAVPSPSVPAYPSGVPTPTACDGALDGACDSSNIVAYETAAKNAALDSYAAGLCTASIAGYSDWFLPSLCELTSDAPGCGSQSAPATQNVQSALLEYNSLSLPSLYYWSATEVSDWPATGVWVYEVNGGAFSATKFSSYPVRCARSLTFYAGADAGFAPRAMALASAAVLPPRLAQSAAQTSPTQASTKLPPPLTTPGVRRSTVPKPIHDAAKPNR